MKEYTVGQKILYLDAGSPVEAVIEQVDAPHFIQVRILKYNGNTASPDWIEAFDAWDLPVMEDRYKEWLKRVELIKQRLDTQEHLLQFLMNRMDMDYEDATEADQACSERIKELFGFDIE